MQTFLPFSSFSDTASVLDYRRLGKQRVETWQILNTLTGTSKLGWRNHPAVKMWAGYETALAHYGIAICTEWIARGYKDTLLPRFSAIPDGDWYDLPHWLGRHDVHASHRSNLLRKDPVWYGQFGWTEDPSAPYVWPAPAQAR